MLEEETSFRCAGSEVGSSPTDLNHIEIIGTFHSISNLCMRIKCMQRHIVRSTIFLASLIVPLISCYYFVKCVIITQARKYSVFNSCVILTENKFWLEVLLKISTWIFIETPSMEAESSMWQKDRQEGRHTDRLTWRCKWSLSHGFAKSPVCASAMSFLLGCEIPV